MNVEGVNFVSEDTIWDLEPHTRAKHDILQNYLAAWFPILSRYSGRIIYLDGFAGPGVYSKGEFGSPVISIKTANEHMLKSRFKNIMFLFIENRKDRAEKLGEVLSETFPDIPNEKIEYYIMSEDFETALTRILDRLEERGRNLAPTFAFIDPFGYTGFSMDLLERILSYKKCEVFITFMSGFIKRFLDEEKEIALNDLFGTDEWKEIRDISGYRDQPLLDLYMSQLKDCCDVKFVNSFKMINKYNQVIYHLIFCTNNLKGLDVMKKAMWRVDRRGEFKFSDREDEHQKYIFDFQDEEHWIPRAAKEVCEKFKGTVVKVSDIEEFVIAETNYIFKKAILRHIEKYNPEKIKDVTVPGKTRRKSSFLDESIIHFN